MKVSFALALASVALSVSAGAQMTRAEPLAAAAADPAAAERIKPFQYLYGSAEAAALQVQTFHALVDYARQQARHRPADSVVLASDATFERPHFVACGRKPFAASSALMRHSIAWPSRRTCSCVSSSGSPSAILICARTRSRPVMTSVTVCSTWMRVFISMK